MESSKQYMHSSLVLVNDEILSTQVRLMELYVRQAEAMAANEAARAQERFQTELTALQEELKQKEIALETQHTLSHQADQNLRTEVQELRARLLATQCSLQVRQTELDFARSDAHVLQQRIAQSESTVQKVYASIEIEVARARETWQEELSALDGQIERKESALQLLQASVKEVEGKLRAEIQDLRSQLAAKADLLKNRTDELQNAQRETALLRRHMQQFALTSAQTEAAASEAIKIRETLQAELASLRTAFEQKDASLQQNQATTKELEERLSAHLHDLQRELAEKQGLLEARGQEVGEFAAKTTDLQEQITCLELANKQTIREAKAAAQAIEDSLRARVQELEATVSEKSCGLQNRTLELESAQSETALLRQHIQQLELTAAQTGAAASEATRIRETMQGELVALRKAIEQKNVSLEENQTATRELEERLTAQLEDSQKELTAKQGLLETRSHEVDELSAKTSDLQEQITCLELANKQTIREAKAAAQAIEDSLRAHVQELEASISEKAQLLQNRAAELESAQSETARFQERIAQLELTGEQTAAVASEATRIRETLQGELVALRKAIEQKNVSLEENQTATRELEERLIAERGDLQKELAAKQGLLEARSQEVDELNAKTSDLQEQITCLDLANKQTVKAAKAAQALEDTLRGRVQELEATVSEKSYGLQNRTLELESAQSETARFQERIAQLELTGTQTEAAKNEAERRLEALQSELSDVHAALEQKDRSSAQTEAEFRESNERLHTQLHALQNQLTENQQLLHAKDGDLGHAAGQTAELKERITQLESLCTETQATAAAEVERVRQNSHAEVLALQSSLGEKERAFQQREAAIAEFEANFNSQIQDLKSQLDRRDQEFQAMGSEATALREHIVRLESDAAEAGRSATAEAECVRRELEVEVAALQTRLTEKERELAKSQVLGQESDGRMQAHIHDLEIQITKKQLLFEASNLEVTDLKNKLTAASEQLAQFEAGQHEARVLANNADLARQSFETELAARQEELQNLKRLLTHREAESYGLQQTFVAQLGDLQKELAAKQGLLEARSQEVDELNAKTSDLQEQITCLDLANKQTVKAAKAAQALEDTLRGRVQELEATVSEKSYGLQNRTLELESAQSETARFQERIAQLELTGTQTEAAKNEAERRLEALQSELSDVHAALEQKDRSSAQTEAEFRESNERLHTQLHALQNQLTEERALREKQKHEIQATRSEIMTLEERLHALESAKAAVETNASVETERLQKEYQVALANLRADLEQRQLVLDENQTTIRELEDQRNSAIHRLEAQVVEKQTLLDRSELEIQKKGSEISALREAITQSELVRKQTELLATTQAEQIREHVKAVVGELDIQLKEKENALKASDDRAQELESRFNARIEDLQRQLLEKQSLMEGQDVELTGLRSQISHVFAQMNGLEHSNVEALEQQRVATAHLEQDLRDEVAGLQTRLAEKLAALGSRDDEIRVLESKITGLVERIGLADAALKQAEAMATSQIEQVRRQSETELAAWQAERDLKADTLQQREEAFNSLDQDRLVEVNGLRAEVAEKHALLQNRNEELLRVKTELDAFQERVAYLESAAKQPDPESLQQADYVGHQNPIELDQLWNEPSQEERVLEDRQLAANDLEQNFQAQIDTLRSELAEKQALLENPSKGFLLGDPSLTESQKEKLNRLEQLVEAIKADNEQSLMSGHNRRWRFSLGRKRRWKS